MSCKHLVRLATYVAGALLTVPVPNHAWAASYQVLHTFETPSGFDPANQGYFPAAGLTLVGSKLFGTTSRGGPADFGTVFSMNLDGSDYQLMHSWTVAPDGVDPVAGLTLIGSKLYGTTQRGGTNNAGTAFAMNLDGSGFQVLRSFTPSSDGWAPISGLTRVAGLQPLLIGTTSQSFGTAFSMNLDGTGYQVLHAFAGNDWFSNPPGDGANPATNLVQSGLRFFGTTESGGLNNGGTVFSVRFNGSDYHVLHNFSAIGNVQVPAQPNALTIVGSKLYGTTFESTVGDGILYSMNFDGTGYQVLHTFTQQTGATFPIDGLTLVGSRLYGTTTGTVYSLNLDGSDFRVEQLIDGDHFYEGRPMLPNNGLTLVGNTLYGIEMTGGPENGGFLYALTVPEPSSFVLAALAGFGILAASLRRHAGKRH